MGLGHSMDMGLFGWGVCGAEPREENGVWVTGFVYCEPYFRQFLGLTLTSQQYGANHPLPNQDDQPQST